MSPHASGDAVATASAPALAHAEAARLHDWLRDRVPGWPAEPAQWQAQRITGGQSNPTWLLDADDGRRWVLRARPGPSHLLLPGAHAIEREFRVLSALHGSEVPVARPLALCEDESVIGAAFYLMAHVDGRVLRDARLPELAPAQRSALHEDAIRVLAALHRLDWRALGLAGFGRPEGYFERLITRWSRQYTQAVSGGIAPIAAMQRLVEALPQRVPSAAGELPAVLTHGDFRLENFIVDEHAPRLRAVLDWELSTLGHPLGDLGYHAMAWYLPAGPLRGLLAPQGLTPGTPSLQAVLARYVTHADPARGDALREALQADWPFYLGVQLFRLAAILQGIGHRHAQGHAAHPQAGDMGRQAQPVAELAWAVLNGNAPDP